MLPAIIFDLDGTLIDSAPDLGNALNKTLKEINRPTLDPKLIRNLVGDGALALIEKGLNYSGGIKNNNTEALRKRFLEIYDEILLKNTKFFPGSLSALNQLNDMGFSLGICSNKPEKPAKKIIKGLKATHLFQCITGGDTYEFRKPHPEHLIRTITAAGRKKNFAIMVGDSQNDIVCAKSVGIPSIAVSFGYSKIPINKLNSDIVLHNYKDLIRFIENLCTEFFDIKL